MDYTCNECGQVAFHGIRIEIINAISDRHKLELRCREKAHRRWAVFVKCKKCGMVPEYLLQYRGATDQKEYPLLRCCGEDWTPKEYHPNPFGTEITI